MVDVELAVVVLSGGESKRFGGDKLRAEIQGRAVIARVFDALSEVTSNLYLSVAERQRGLALLNLLDRNVKLILDRKNLSCAGPALAISSSVSSVNARHILFTSADTPWLDPKGLRKFVEICVAAACDIGTPYWSNGMVETLVQFHNRTEILKVIHTITRLRRNHMRPSDILRGATRTLYVNVAQITKNPFCFSNINTRDDLVNPKARGEIGSHGESIIADGEAKRLFWKAANLQANGNIEVAAREFEKESQLYEAYGLTHIATHCLADAISCLKALPGDVGRLKERLEKLKTTLPILPRA